MNNLIFKLMLISLVLFVGSEAVPPNCTSRCIVTKCSENFSQACKNNCKCECLRSKNIKFNEKLYCSDVSKQTTASST
ncbi:uncharacterized protein LOC106875685 [Octopus bimaculoides]|uniref:TIL domain-containing protein n=1 Tax=Octopus bimaculoides TaxID=37653 RepID=A0A0L8GNH2_OCTBM|nr:uncharacterized protein LOC106875685 [Octopus bimaculoides]|eukprot:XP_014779420.1 PREDICTED: uncharacterized protein LOC106875685 [Octopus bimaculoides]